MTIRLRVACWIGKATRTHPYTHREKQASKHAHARTHTHQYVILIAFPRQQWFRERASVLRYTCTACIVRIRILDSTTLWILFLFHGVFNTARLSTYYSYAMTVRI